MDSWQQLYTLLKHAPAHAELLLQRPCLTTLPDNNSLMAIMGEAVACDLAGLLRKHLLSRLAIEKDCDAWEKFYLGLLSEIVSQSGLSTLHDSSWLMLPLLTAQGGCIGRLVHILVGVVPDNTGAPPLTVSLSDVSITALAITSWTYAEAYGLRARRLIAIPLMGDRAPVISGCSLSLPFVLALHLLDRGLPWPHGLYATGCLRSDGKIDPVSGVAVKCEAAARNGGRTIFVPMRNSEQVSSPLVAIPCSTMEQALDDLDYLLLADEPEMLAQFRPLIVNERVLLSHLHEIPSVLLDHPVCVSAFERIGKRPVEFLHHAVQALHACSFDGARGTRLADLFPLNVLEKMAREEGNRCAQTVYEWCISRIAYANHRGDTGDVERWEAFQRSIEDAVEADFHLVAWNHLFVAERFNRYHFSQDIPDDIQRLVADEEARNRVAPRPNKHLGAMYGTLSQNCGFCGPRWFSGLDSYAAKAEASFGRRFSSEKNRLLLYRVYGYLDLDDCTQAAIWLDRYLGIDHNGGPGDWLEEIPLLITRQQEGWLFGLAVVTRVLADMGEGQGTKRLQSLRELLMRAMPRQARHPWQLILLNLARMLGEAGLNQECRVALQRMISICQQGGETMQVMALLAYAELQFRGLLDEEALTAVEDLRRRILSSRFLFQPHFSGLRRQQTIRATLDDLHHHRATWFPFTYR